LANGDFASAKNGQPESWNHWQDEKESHGSFSCDQAVGAASPGSARLSGVEHGCFLQALRVQPGQRYLVSAKVRQSGTGAAWLTARWQTPEEKWTAEDKDKRVSAPTQKDSSSWQEVVGIVTVTAGAGRLMLLLGASGQQNADDRVWFDDVLAVRLAN
jgi:hypothetical protein